MVLINGKQYTGNGEFVKATLLGAAFVGGSVGGLAGMYIFRHKTKNVILY